MSSRIYPDLPTTRLLIVRHGETSYSRDNVCYGTTEVPLTELGLLQAKTLAERLRHEDINAIYCSPQERARQTATPSANQLQLPLQTRLALREMDFGRWENIPRERLKQEYPAELAAWDRGSWMSCPPGGETQQAVLARTVPCLTDLLVKHSGETLLLVSHQTVIRLLVGHLLDMSLSASRRLNVANASVTELHITGDVVHLTRFNDNAHLRSLQQ
ncbi:histidine phosphatase family protein [Ktedonospora formicarum]|uniref:Phosphoglycerate mutase n=1 Tax=Ktedonospora formicarum TaxID=2778364 RepID=A0A8J3MSV3_9CHLR|nr:histidine phosphatase family protein [Ktedonospora formicarum]GHO45236.1 phosphoglycerate mutase [Ktedonospora formicarum]